MAYDHTEQEQLDELKAWWKTYGNLITWLLIAVLLAFSTWKMWGIYQGQQAAQASKLYEEVQKALQDKDAAKLQRAVTDIQEKYAGTEYAQMAGLLSAKSAFDINDLKTAKARLVWVQEHGKTDEFKAIAKLRLASILQDEKSFDEALKLLSGEFPTELLASVADKKGDILVAQNKLAEARTAYQLALDKSTDQNPSRQLIQLKLDAIGGPVAKVANK